MFWLVCVGSFWVLWLPPTIEKNVYWGVRLIGHSKFSVGVNVSVDGCLSLYVSPGMNWWLVQDVPYLYPMMLEPPTPRGLTPKLWILITACVVIVTIPKNHDQISSSRSHLHTDCMS